MRTDDQMATIVARKVKEVHQEFVQRWGFPARVVASATLGFSVAALIDSGHTEEEIVAAVHQLAGRSAP